MAMMLAELPKNYDVDSLVLTVYMKDKELKQQAAGGADLLKKDAKMKGEVLNWRTVHSRWCISFVSRPDVHCVGGQCRTPPLIPRCLSRRAYCAHPSHSAQRQS